MVLYLTWQQRHSCTHYESICQTKALASMGSACYQLLTHKSHMSCSHYGMTNRKNHNTLLFNVNGREDNMKKSA